MESATRAVRKCRSADGLLSVHDVAPLLNLGASTVYRWAKAGIIPCHRLNGRTGPVRFVRAEIDAYIAKTKVKPVGRPQTDYGHLHAA